MRDGFLPPPTIVAGTKMSVVGWRVGVASAAIFFEKLPFLLFSGLSTDSECHFLSETYLTSLSYDWQSPRPKNKKESQKINGRQGREEKGGKLCSPLLTPATPFA